MRRGIVGSALTLGLVLVEAQAAPALNNQSASAAHLIGFNRGAKATTVTIGLAGVSAVSGGTVTVLNGTSFPVPERNL